MTPKINTQHPARTIVLHQPDGGTIGFCSHYFMMKMIVQIEKRDAANCIKDRLACRHETMLKIAVQHRIKCLEVLPPEQAILGGPKDLNGVPAPFSYQCDFENLKVDWDCYNKVFALNHSTQSITFPHEALQAFVDDYLVSLKS